MMAMPLYKGETVYLTPVKEKSDFLDLACEQSNTSRVWVLMYFACTKQLSMELKTFVFFVRANVRHVLQQLQERSIGQ